MHQTFLRREPFAHPRRNRTERFGDLPELVPFVSTGKQRRPRVHLDENASQRPRVNLNTVRQTQYNLRGPIEPRLDVREIRGIPDEAAAAKVDEFHGAPIRADQEDVFGLYVAVHHADGCLLYTSPSPRDQRGSRMPSSA